METGFYWIGVVCTAYAFWWFVLRHISYALSAAISGSVRLAKLDFSALDPNKIDVEIAKHFSNWDKLWLVPRHFRNVFFRELKSHWRYH